MEYIIEQFDIDLRKLDLYIENAENEYMFACEEANLYDDDDIIVEAEETLSDKIGNFFTTLIEKIRNTISKILEKIKELFTKKKAENITKIIKSNPNIAKEKVKIPDVKKIKDVCGKRKMLLKSLVKKAEAGKLTEDDLDKAVEKYDKYTKIAKGVGLTVVAAGSVVGLIAYGTHVANECEAIDDGVSDIKKIKNLRRINNRLKHGAPSVKKHKRAIELDHKENSAGETIHDDAHEYALRASINDRGVGNHEPDLSSHRKLAKMIALNATDTAQLDAMIANCTLDELVKLINTAEARDRVLLARIKNTDGYNRRALMSINDMDITDDTRIRIYNNIHDKINDKQSK